MIAFHEGAIMAWLHVHNLVIAVHTAMTVPLAELCW